MLTTSRAIVLRTVRHTDSSSIARLYTEAAGVLSFAVRIPKTHRAQVRSKLFQPLAQLDIAWDHREQQPLQRLRRCEVALPYQSLPYHPVKASVALFLAEFLHGALRGEKQPSPSLYRFLSGAFEWLDLTDRGLANFHIAFLVQLAAYLGIQPSLGDRTTDTFDLLEGSYTAVTPCHAYIIKGIDAARLPLLGRMNFRNMARYRLCAADRRRILDAIATYYRLHIPAFPELKSLDVLHAIFSD